MCVRVYTYKHAIFKGQASPLMRVSYAQRRHRPCNYCILLCCLGCFNVPVCMYTTGVAAVVVESAGLVCATLC